MYCTGAHIINDIMMSAYQKSSFFFSQFHFCNISFIHKSRMYMQYPWTQWIFHELLTGICFKHLTCQWGLIKFLLWTMHINVFHRTSMNLFLTDKRINVLVHTWQEILWSYSKIFYYVVHVQHSYHNIIKILGKYVYTCTLFMVKQL